MGLGNEDGGEIDIDVCDDGCGTLSSACGEPMSMSKGSVLGISGSESGMVISVVKGGP